MELVAFEGISYRDVAFTVYLPVEPAKHMFSKRLTPDARVQPVVWVMRVGEDIN